MSLSPDPGEGLPWELPSEKRHGGPADLCCASVLAPGLFVIGQVCSPGFHFPSVKNIWLK